MRERERNHKSERHRSLYSDRNKHRKVRMAEKDYSRKRVSLVNQTPWEKNKGTF